MAVSSQASPARKANATAIFDLKSASLSVLALLLKTPDVTQLAQALEARYGSSAGLFEHEPLCIDLAALQAEPEVPDFPALLALLRTHGFHPVAARGGSPEQMAAAREAGLSEVPDDSPPARSDAADAGAQAEPANAEPAEAAPEPEQPPAPAAESQAVQAPVPAVRTVIVDKPLRSGQQVYARGADLIVLAVVSYGAEVIADGSIHVYAPLRGRALAGAQGDPGARIFSACMEPQLVSIAGTWRTLESGLAADVAGKPAQVRLEGDKLIFEALKF